MQKEGDHYRQKEQYVQRHRVWHIQKFAGSLFFFIMAVKYRFDWLFPIHLVKDKIRELRKNTSYSPCTRDKNAR